jgi:hypothetical protein
VSPEANRDNVAVFSVLGLGFAVGVMLGAFWLAVPMVVMAVLAGYLHRRDGRQRLRHVRGQCIKCGYDLRASPERCPECGTVRR